MYAYKYNLKTISAAQIISKKCMQTLPNIGKLYHRFKQNVLESESRQFDRLKLLARCHDSGRLRLRFCTPDTKSRLFRLSMLFYKELENRVMLIGRNKAHGSDLHFKSLLFIQTLTMMANNFFLICGENIGF